MGLEKDYQEITLPESGEKLTVRHLSTLDYQMAGSLPDTALGTFLKMVGKKEVSVQDLDAETAKFLIKAMMRGIVKQSGELKIVEKDPQDCSVKEIAFVDLKNEDQGTLMSAILSGGEGLPLDFLKALGREIRKIQAGEDEEQSDSKNTD